MKLSFETATVSNVVRTYLLDIHRTLIRNRTVIRFEIDFHPGRLFGTGRLLDFDNLSCQDSYLDLDYNSELQSNIFIYKISWLPQPYSQHVAHAQLFFDIYRYTLQTFTGITGNSQELLVHCTGFSLLQVKTFNIHRGFLYIIQETPVNSLQPRRFNRDSLLNLQLNYRGEVIHRVFLYIIQGT